MNFAPLAQILLEFEGLSSGAHLRFVEVFGHLYDDTRIMVINHAGLDFGQDVDYLALIRLKILSLTQEGWIPLSRASV